MPWGALRTTAIFFILDSAGPSKQKAKKSALNRFFPCAVVKSNPVAPNICILKYLPTDRFLLTWGINEAEYLNRGLALSSPIIKLCSLSRQS